MELAEEAKPGWTKNKTKRTNGRKRPNEQKTRQNEQTDKKLTNGQKQDKKVSDALLQES